MFKIHKTAREEACMKGLFSKVSIKSQNTMSKQDKKKVNAKSSIKLDQKAEYKVCSISSKIKLYRDDKSIILFEYYDRVFPTIHSFDRSCFKRVVLDAGAVGPLMRGADVMCPGVIKYKDMSDDFEENEIVGIEIIDQGIIGVGVTLMSYNEMIKKKEGPVIDVLHIKGDFIDLDRN